MTCGLVLVTIEACAVGYSMSMIKSNTAAGFVGAIAAIGLISSFMLQGKLVTHSLSTCFNGLFVQSGNNDNQRMLHQYGGSGSDT